MRFVSLHHHSTHSNMDGVGLPAEHHERAAELGMTAMALTEHGNVSSHVQHEKASKKSGVKPIYGVEAYTQSEKSQRKFHLTILAENETGYRNLNRLVSRSYSENFYYWPTVSGEMLADHHEGLIVLSGCADSMMACTLFGGKTMGDQQLKLREGGWEEAVRLASSFKELFGDRYFLEVQQFPGLARTRVLNPALAELGEKLNIPLAATADVHYPNPDDNELQKIVHAAGRGAGSVRAVEASWEYDILLTHPTSDRLIGKNLMGTGLSRNQAWEAILSTEAIGQQATVTLPRSDFLRYPLEGQAESAQELIWDWLRRGWKYRARENKNMRKDPDAYHERLKHEMNVIQGKPGYHDYFLMLSDIVRFAKNKGIPVGPARGSAAASLVCYLLRITEVDPLQFPQMMFERFLDPGRDDLPDVDLDFSDDRRDEVRQHMVKRYGEGRVGNIGNFVRYRGKNSINDVARVYHIPKWEAETVNSLIIERSGGDSRISDSLQDTFDMFPAAQAVLDRHPELNNAVRLEGNYRGRSTHAAGFVVSNNPITDVCAIYAKDGKDILAYDKYDVAYLGMLKMDFLGLKTMGMIDIALHLIDMELSDLYRVPLTDKKTLKGFRDNDVVGIFQFEGRATRLVNQDVVPDHFMHLADINALSRPGPLFSGMTAKYVEVKHGRSQVEHLHPIVDKYTQNTYGQIVYQEQVLGIIRELGGFPVRAVGDIRRIISQKLGEAQFNSMRDDFLKGAKELHDVDEQLAGTIWKYMVTSATYSFNIAHCVSYSMLGFWSMYLKQHYPHEFYVAQLRKLDPNDKHKLPRLLKDALKRGIKVKPPSIKSDALTWHAAGKKSSASSAANQAPIGSSKRSGGAIRAGLVQIPGIGAGYARNIAEARAAAKAQGREWTEWRNLMEAKGIGPKTIEKIVDFCESDDPFGLKAAQRVLDKYRYYVAENGLPIPTHTADEIPRQGEHRVTWIGLVKDKQYKDLIEDERARTGDELEVIKARLKDPHLLKSCVLHCYDDGDEECYLRFNRWRFPNFKDALEGIVTGTDGDVVLASGLKRGGFGVSIQVDSLYVISQDDEDE